MSGNQEQHIEEELNLSVSAMYQDNILELIYLQHVHHQTVEMFDDDSLFIIVQNILKRATLAVDKIMKGARADIQVLETINGKIPKANFNVPLCRLKQISHEMSCKAPGEQIAQNTTVSILEMLSRYSWEAKAALTVAAFAMEYGDFWLLAQVLESDPLAHSLGTIRKVFVLLKSSEVRKRRLEVLELNNLIKTVLHVLEIIFEFKIISTYDPNDVPSLLEMNRIIPEAVCWVIRTVVACTTKLDILRSYEDKRHDVSPYAQKVQHILNKLKSRLTCCLHEIGQEENRGKIKKIYETSTDISVFIKALISDNVEQLLDCSTKRMVKIDHVLNQKNVFVFISTLDVSDDIISLIAQVYEKIKEERLQQYAIVWIPIVEQWTDELQSRFQNLQREMSWYSVHDCNSPIAGIKFIKVDWKFPGTSALITMTPQGKVEYFYALDLLHTWGMKAFPFDREAEERVTKELNWIGKAVQGFDSRLDNWFREERYIFFYGGKTNWIEQIEQIATGLGSEVRETIGLEFLSIREGSTQATTFWDRIGNLFHDNINSAKLPFDPVEEETQRLFSYKNEVGWAVFAKGSRVVIACHGSIFLNVLENVNQWGDGLPDQTAFEDTFKNKYKQHFNERKPCSHIKIPSTAGKIPDQYTCTECFRTMKIVISYECCHDE